MRERRFAAKSLLIGAFAILLAACTSPGPQSRSAATAPIVGADGRLLANVGGRTGTAAFIPILAKGCEAPCRTPVDVFPPEDGKPTFNVVLLTDDPTVSIGRDNAIRVEIDRGPAGARTEQRVVLFVFVQDGRIAARAFERASRRELAVRLYDATH